MGTLRLGLAQIRQTDRLEQNWERFKEYFARAVDAGVDLTTRHTPLVTAGSIIGVLGLVLATLIGLNWEVCVAATSKSGAAQALTAAVGVCIIGFGLFYAGLPKKSAG